MSDETGAEATPAEPDAAMVEAFAKQLFRAENPPAVLWDTKLFEQAGRSTEGLAVASQETKDVYLKRARGVLLNGQD